MVPIWVLCLAVAVAAAIGYSIASLRRAQHTVDRILAEELARPPIRGRHSDNR